jgi:hypothetical protein
MSGNHYFQFPLCALSFGENAYARLNAILDYSVVEAGSKLFRKLTVAEQNEFLRGKLASRRNRGGVGPYDGLRHAAFYGAHVIGVIYHDLDAVIERHKAMRLHICDFVSRCEADAQVRIKKDWLFKARDERGISYREFSVLCGIFSAIGDKEQAHVTRDRIRRCALGYRTAAIMQAELPHRADNAQPLTERQLRDTIERLHQNKFFARCTVARRITYYSIRLDNEALRKKVFEIQTYKAFHRATLAAQDEMLTKAIKEKRYQAAQSARKTSPATPRFKFTLSGDPH